jgi:hypothetical protein
MAIRTVTPKNNSSIPIEIVAAAIKPLRAGWNTTASFPLVHDEYENENRLVCHPEDRIL